MAYMHLFLLDLVSVFFFLPMWSLRTHFYIDMQGDDTTDSARRRSNRKARARRSTHGEPSSITDEEPKDAHQLLSSGSDSE